MSQESAIIDWLLSGRTLTPIEALERFGCFRLAARICDIRKAIPVKVGRKMLPSGKVVAEYSIA
jgi:hypothetical protein